MGICPTHELFLISFSKHHDRATLPLHTLLHKEQRQLSLPSDACVKTSPLPALFWDK